MNFQCSACFIEMRSKFMFHCDEIESWKKKKSEKGRERERKVIWINVFLGTPNNRMVQPSLTKLQHQITTTTSSNEHCHRDDTSSIPIVGFNEVMILIRTRKKRIQREWNKKNERKTCIFQLYGMLLPVQSSSGILVWSPVCWYE